MKPFKIHQGKIALLEKNNIDTDQIIPKQFLKTITRSGLGKSLFYDWRYLNNGKPNPSFQLNLPQYRGASLLVTGHNFGCGSSREHAVWALQEYGFRVIIAPRKDQNQIITPAFAEIFATNASKNGLLLIELSEVEVQEIFLIARSTKNLEATIDLPEQKIIFELPRRMALTFSIDNLLKQRLIEGTDDIAQTLRYEEQIKCFEAQHDFQIQSG